MVNNDKDGREHITIDQQLLEIKQQIDRIRNQLRQSDPQRSREVVNNLAQISNRMTRLEYRIKQNEEERKDLHALADIGGVVNSSLELDEVLRIVMDTFVSLTGAERGFLMLREKDEEMSIRIARNWEQESIAPADFAISSTVVNRTANQGKPILTTDAQEDPQFDARESIIAHDLRSILCVPLKVKEKITGVIYADNRVFSGIFSETDRDLLAAFANQAAIAIENARLFESILHTLAEVTELKNLTENIFASIASGVITTDEDTKITLCNRAAEEILGHSAADLIGHYLDESQPSLASRLYSPISTVYQNDQSLTGLEISSKLTQKGDVDLLVNLSPLKDAQQTTQGVAIVLDDLTEKKRMEAQHRLFERMVSPAVIAQIDPEKFQLGGERSSITVLFADVRGFTSFSETVDPERLVSLLNGYLSTAIEAVLAQEGTIDKFMGDAIMAWFNAPILQPDHTLRAVRAAIWMRRAMRLFHKELPEEFRLDFGIGIHCGEALLGLVGSENRLEYTAIGDSVNTAKRIQENAEAGQILISVDAYNNVSEKVEVKEVIPILAKGKREPINVYEVTGVR